MTFARGLLQASVLGRNDGRCDCSECWIDDFSWLKKKESLISGDGRRFYPKMILQISWTTLPGLRGLSCSEFRATPTASPDTERGVVFECASEAERDALLAKLEAHFGSRRFVTTSAAFDAVKDFANFRSARKNL